MAIIKNIVLDNGITVNYHRVVSVNNITNIASLIEVASYTSKEKREEEKLALANSEAMNVFINTQYINMEYSQTFDVDSAYAHLKTLDKFANSTDDME